MDDETGFDPFKEAVLQRLSSIDARLSALESSVAETAKIGSVFEGFGQSMGLVPDDSQGVPMLSGD